MTGNNQPGREAEPVGSKAANPEMQALLRGAISVFILFHLIAIACWAVPLEISPIQDVREIVRPYMIWSGLFQSWDFFAPNPKSVNTFLEAVVITQSHRQKVWVFPRMEQLSYGERYSKERYRKFAEVLPQRKNAALWPDVAKHIARLTDSPADRPEIILLIQFQAPIKPGSGPASNPNPKPNAFYEYENYVPAEDVR